MDEIKKDAAEGYLSEIIERLQGEGFDIKTDIEHKNHAFDYVARRKRFEFDKQSFVFMFFVFSQFPSLDIATLKDFSATAYNYAVKSFAIPLPRGLFCGITCYPVAVIGNIDSDVSQYIRKKAPPKHWAAFETPVIYCLETKELHYCEISPLYGRMYYGEFRFIINSMLTP